MPITTPDAVLEFWFGDALTSGSAYMQRFSFWYSVSDETDAEIRDRFEDSLEAAARGELDDWKAEPRSLLALTIMLDQFPRNIHRGTAQCFAYDDKALACCMQAIESGKDRDLHPGERQFLYLPLQHSESPEVQELSVQTYEQLVEEGKGHAFEAMLGGGAEYASKHRDIIAGFGRYPHRNDAMGRQSTPEEIEYLKTAERFGQ
jgi:uncharacterized protein (DUF924 family)